MSRNIFCILLSMFFLGAASQPYGNAVSGFRITRLDYDNSSGEKGSTNFRYNNRGELIKSYWFLENGSRSSENSYQLDVNGKIVCTIRKYSDEIITSELFFYDAIGNKTREHFFSSDGKSGNACYSYSDNLLMEAVFTNHKGWLNGVFRNRYNGQGRPDSAFLTRNNKPICTVLYTYDTIGNLALEHWDFNGKWEQDFRYIYQRVSTSPNYYASPWLSNAGEARIIAETYSYNGTVGGPSAYFYNKEGLLTKKIFTRTDGFTTASTYAYGASGVLENSERVSNDGKRTRFTYHYDSDGRLILKNYFVRDTLVGFEAYRYSPSGELVFGEVKNMDGWLTGSIHFFIGTNGYLKKAVFNGENGRKADILFETNEPGLVTNVRWDFSDGTWQEYLYSYE
jgi:hypothetical protein